MKAANIETAAELARRSSPRQNATTVRSYLTDGPNRRNPPLDVCMAMAAPLGVSGQWIFDGKGPRHPQPAAGAQKAEALIEDLPFIPVLGKVAAGAFIEIMPIDPDDIKPSQFPPDPRYPVAAQFDLLVEGPSINRFAQDGDMLRCVHITKAGLEIRDGDLVIVERTRDSSLRETTAKRLKIRPNGIYEFWPESDHPKYQEPFKVRNGGTDQHDEISILARVIWKYRIP